MTTKCEPGTQPAKVLPSDDDDTRPSGKAKRRRAHPFDVCRFLSKPRSYPHATATVEVIETHISWVFLTDRFAYKLKKPVRFEFLDFSTVERRHDACAQEVKLNRRLAPEVYVDVVPIVADSGHRLHLGGSGQPIDWTVRMKRLPAHCALDRRIGAGQLELRDVAELAAKLANFYKRLPPVTVRTDEYCRQLESHIRANLSELVDRFYKFDSASLERVHGAQLRFLSLYREQLVDRVRDGRVVDGHGDLRPEHIYFAPAPKIIDCIEFSTELRIIDVVDELAFLAMECDKLGADWVGQQILARYTDESGDRPSPSLIDFFKAYRACVRAKVNALRAKQIDVAHAGPLLNAAGEYLRLALRYATRLGPPILIVVRGLSGTGKSTLAESLADAWGCQRLQTNVVREQLFGSPPQPIHYNSGCYSPANRQLVYEELFRRANDSLGQGLSVILDGTFPLRALRARATEVAGQHQAKILLVNCQCPSGIAVERMQERAVPGSLPSEVCLRLLTLQRDAEENDDPSWPVCPVDTSEGLPMARQEIFEQVRESLKLR